MTRWTPEQYAELLKRRNAAAQPLAPAAPVLLRPRYRSQLEAEYAATLELRKRAGEIVDYGYERISLLLPGAISYRPDFDAVLPDGHIEIHECKGWQREVARDRLRSAIATYPAFRWFIVGVDRQPVRMLMPDDVPSARKVVGK
ncbi:MAG: hypothetical protein AB7G13_28720 [Lautropia sp.]